MEPSRIFEDNRRIRVENDAVRAIQSFIGLISEGAMSHPRTFVGRLVANILTAPVILRPVSHGIWIPSAGRTHPFAVCAAENLEIFGWRHLVEEGDIRARFRVGSENPRPHASTLLAPCLASVANRRQDWDCLDPGDSRELRSAPINDAAAVLYSGCGSWGAVRLADPNPEQAVRTATRGKMPSAFSMH